MAEGQWRLQHDPLDGGLLVTTCAVWPFRSCKVPREKRIESNDRASSRYEFSFQVSPGGSYFEIARRHQRFVNVSGGYRAEALEMSQCGEFHKRPSGGVETTSGELIRVERQG